MQTLAQIFNNSFFRVPDYQRGYAWEESQLEDFWKDLNWLRPGQQHYTGMLTLYPVERPYPTEFPTNSPHTLYHVVDGQQRLTTSYLLLNKLVRRTRDQMIGGQPAGIVSHNYIAASINGISYPIFGYDSQEKMQFLKGLFEYENTKAAKKAGNPAPRNIYERNLIYASRYFDAKLSGLSQISIDALFNSLTTQLVFDTHHVKNTFEVCAMFESINYRGKRLTKFEVLKNRLMYLCELIRQADPSQDKRSHELRRLIETEWGIAFDWLGYGGNPLDEDDFLHQHTIMYFGSLKKEKDALDNLLFKEIFSTDRLSSSDSKQIKLSEIEDYVKNIGRSSELWAFQNSRISKLSGTPVWANQEVVNWLIRLNRIGIGHFNPLILGALNRMKDGKTKESQETLVGLLNEIERFIFIMFGLCSYAKNHTSKSTFKEYGYGIYFNEDGFSFSEIISELKDFIYSFDEDDEFVGEFDLDKFTNEVNARFHKDKGWYSWSNYIKYFLCEWETHLSGMPMTAEQYANQSIEHVMPQNPESSGQWMRNQKELGRRFKYVVHDLGNLMLIGIGANKAIQDIDLKSKAEAYERIHAGKDILKRAGKQFLWSEPQILARGKIMVDFIRDHWRLPGQEKGSDYRIEADAILSTELKPPRKPNSRIF